MAKRRKDDDAGENRLVFSTNPDTMADFFSNIKLGEEAKENEPMGKTDEIRVWIDRKRRGGKKAVVIKGIKGTNRQLDELAKFIKSKCGVGGAAKDGEIIIQGDRRDKVIEILESKGYSNVKSAGG